MSLSDTYIELDAWDENSSSSIECHESFEELEQSLLTLLSETDSALDESLLTPVSLKVKGLHSSSLPSGQLQSRIIAQCTEMSNSNKSCASEVNAVLRDTEDSGTKKKKALKRPPFNEQLLTIAEKRQKVDSEKGSKDSCMSNVLHHKAELNDVQHAPTYLVTEASWLDCNKENFESLSALDGRSKSSNQQKPTFEDIANIMTPVEEMCDNPNVITSSKSQMLVQCELTTNKLFSRDTSTEVKQDISAKSFSVTPTQIAQPPISGSCKPLCQSGYSENCIKLSEKPPPQVTIEDVQHKQMSSSSVSASDELATKESLIAEVIDNSVSGQNVEVSNECSSTYISSNFQLDAPIDVKDKTSELDNDKPELVSHDSSKLPDPDTSINLPQDSPTSVHLSPHSQEQIKNEITKQSRNDSSPQKTDDCQTTPRKTNSLKSFAEHFAETLFSSTPLPNRIKIHEDLDCKDLPTLDVSLECQKSCTEANPSSDLTEGFAQNLCSIPLPSTINIHKDTGCPELSSVKISISSLKGNPTHTTTNPSSSLAENFVLNLSSISLPSIIKIYKNSDCINLSTVNISISSVKNNTTCTVTNESGNLVECFAQSLSGIPLPSTIKIEKDLNCTDLSTVTSSQKNNPTCTETVSTSNLSEYFVLNLSCIPTSSTIKIDKGCQNLSTVNISISSMENSPACTNDPQANLAEHYAPNLSSLPLPSIIKIHKNPDCTDLSTLGLSISSLKDDSCIEPKILDIDGKLSFGHWLKNSAIKAAEKMDSFHEGKAILKPTNEEEDVIDEELEATLLDFSLEVLRDGADTRTIAILNKSFGAGQRNDVDNVSGSPLTKNTAIGDTHSSSSTFVEERTDVTSDTADSDEVIFVSEEIPKSKLMAENAEVIELSSGESSPEHDLKPKNACSKIVGSIQNFKCKLDTVIGKENLTTSEKIHEEKLLKSEKGNNNTAPFLSKTSTEAHTLEINDTVKKQENSLCKVSTADEKNKTLSCEQKTCSTKPGVLSDKTIKPLEVSNNQSIDSAKIKSNGAKAISVTAEQIVKPDKPKISYPEENKDIEHPDWEIIKKLNTDEERYKQVRARWRSHNVPDPNQDLTYHSYRRKRALEKKMKYSPILPPKTHGHKRSATSDSHQPKKRARTKTVPCTYIIDSKIDAVRREFVQNTNIVRNQLHSQMQVLEDQHRELMFSQSIEPNDYRFPFYDSYVNAMSTAAYHAMMMQNKAEKNRLLFDHEARVHEARRKCDSELNALLEARAEINKFCSFYKGLSGHNEENDPTVITESQMQELNDIEKVYNLFKHHYYDPNHM